MINKIENQKSLPSESRRRVLRMLVGGAVAGASGLVLPTTALAYEQQTIQVPVVELWPKPNDIRQIWIKRQETNEVGILRYFDGQQLDITQYSRACTILRDVHAGQVANIDVELLDLMFAMQRWLVSWGVDKPLIINSGFRTNLTNSRLEGAAKNSMHLQGRAADITMPGVGAEYLGRLAAIFARGGVGFYVDRGFVHIDTGSVRYWNSRKRTA